LESLRKTLLKISAADEYSSRSSRALPRSMAALASLIALASAPRAGQTAGTIANPMNNEQEINLMEAPSIQKLVTHSVAAMLADCGLTSKQI
jgi:hypothetical protein